MREKGFTLIELLAVIVILAIIALIATPMILGVIDSAKKGAAESSTYGYIDAIEKSTLQYMITTGNYTSKPEGTYDLTTIGTVSYKGNSPKAICVTIKDGSVESGSFQFDNYIVDYDGKKAKVNSNKTEVSCIPTTPEENVGFLEVGLPKGTAVYFNPETKTKCDASNAISTTGTKTGCMKWYVYKDNENGTYQLILDHNTTPEVAWNLSGNNADGMSEVVTALTSDTITWNSSLSARIITVDEIAGITGNTSFNGATSTSDKWFYLDSNNHAQPETSQGSSTYAWLFDYTTSCEDYGCNIGDNSISGYWTSTPVAGETNRVWVVRSYGDIGYYNASSTYIGVRPVITL